MSDREVIEAMYAAFAQRDFDTFRLLCADGLEWIQNPGFPNGKTYIGADAVIDGVFNANDNRWANFRFQSESIDAVEGRVFVMGHYTGRSRTTNVPFSVAATHVYDVVDHHITRLRMFADTHILHQNL